MKGIDGQGGQERVEQVLLKPPTNERQILEPYLMHQTVSHCPKPVIARVRGYCIGGANHLAYFCDFTIAAEHAIFGQNGPRVGSPACGAIVSYLTRVIGAKRAREMWMLSRRYSAAQALDMGLVNVVVPLAKLDVTPKPLARKPLQGPSATRGTGTAVTR